MNEDKKQSEKFVSSDPFVSSEKFVKSERFVFEKNEEESSIDFGKIFQDLLRHKMLYVKVLPVAFILAAIYALSLPNFYNCTVKLSPELSSSRSTSGLASLASSFGVNLGQGTAGMGTEALFPTLYPDLMNSVDFKTSLFDVPVTIEGDAEIPLVVCRYESSILNLQISKLKTQRKSRSFPPDFGAGQYCKGY